MIDSGAGCLGSMVDLPGRAVEVPGGLVPLLPLASIHRQLDGVAVGPVKGLVPVQEGLDPIVPGGNLRQALHRVAQRGGVDHGVLAGLQPLDVDAEDLLGLRAVVDLEPRLLGGVLREHDQDPAVERRRALLRSEPDPELRSRPFQRQGRGGWKRPGRRTTGHRCEQ